MARNRPLALLSAALWLAFVLLIAAAMFVLLRACGLVLPGYGSWHRIGFAYCLERKAAIPVDAERTRALREQALQLEVRLLRQRASCIAQSMPPARPPEVAARPRPQGQGPSVQGPQGLRGPEVAGREPQKPPTSPPSAPGQDFPQDKWANKDISVLNGCWQLGKEIKRPIGVREKNPDICLVIKAVRLCLDPTGSGKAEVRGEDCPPPGPTSCEAPITAAFAGDGTLRMTTKPATCPDSTHWPKTVFNCRRIDDKALRCADPSGGEELEFRR